jgi:hypothetical protein
MVRTMLDQSQSSEVASRHGQVLFGSDDANRAIESQATLKTRFARDFATLQANLS